MRGRTNQEAGTVFDDSHTCRARVNRQFFLLPLLFPNPATANTSPAQYRLRQTSVLPLYPGSRYSWTLIEQRNVHIQKPAPQGPTHQFLFSFSRRKKKKKKKKKKSPSFPHFFFFRRKKKKKKKKKNSTSLHSFFFLFFHILFHDDHAKTTKDIDRSFGFGNTGI